MDHKDHISLIEKVVPKPAGIWADLGSGTGAFTLALRDVAGAEVEIYSVDQYSPSLDVQEEAFERLFPDSNVHYLHMDFTEELLVPELDGILMANSLHYVKDQEKFLRKIRKYLKPHGALLLVEYNAEVGNQWVPYPLSFNKFQSLADEAGFKPPTMLHKVPSTFLNEIYAAVTYLD